MKLISVDSAIHTASANAVDLMITADLGTGNQSLPYTWVQGDPHGLGPQVDAFFVANPAFPIAAYVAPVIDLNALDLATINAALAQPGSIVRALGLVMFSEVNVLRAALALPPRTMPQFIAALKAQIR